MRNLNCLLLFAKHLNATKATGIPGITLCSTDTNSQKFECNYVSKNNRELCILCMPTCRKMRHALLPKRKKLFPKFRNNNIVPNLNILKHLIIAFTYIEGL